MHKKTIFLASLLVLLLGTTAWAEDWGRIMTPKNPLNVREERTPTSKRITTIMPGEKVRADFLEDGWYALFRMDVKERSEHKAFGFVKASYLVPVGEWGEYRTPRDGMLNIRSKRSVRSEHVRTLRPGDVVKVDFEEDGWVAVFEPEEKVRSLKNAIGYSNDRYLYPAAADEIDNVLGANHSAPAANLIGASSVAQPTPPTGIDENVAESQPLVPNTPSIALGSVEAAPVVPATESSHWGRLVKVSRRVNMRAERTAASKLVDTLEPGKAVRVDFLRKGWFAAFKAGETRRDEKYALGYIYAALIEDDMSALPDVTPPDRQALPLGEPNRPVKQSAEPQKETPLYQVRGTVSSAPPQELTEPVVSVPAERVTSSVSTQQPESETVSSEPRKTVVASPKIVEPHKGPLPVADQVRHGYRYSLFERQESREGRYPLDVLRVYLDVNVVPEAASLSDFCATLWKEEWRQGTLLRVDVYLPGMDLKDLSYAEALFDGKGLRQFWTRETVLIGTRFKR